MNMPEDMRVKIAGRYWRLQFVERLPKMLGVTDNPKRKNKGIRIRRSLKGELLLDTIIHELLHAAQWDFGEEWIDHTATQIASVLTAAGWHWSDDSVECERKVLAGLITNCLKLTSPHKERDVWAVSTGDEVSVVLEKLGLRK